MMEMGKCEPCRINLLKEVLKIQKANVPSQLKFVVILELDSFHNHFQALIFIEKNFLRFAYYRTETTT